MPESSDRLESLLAYCCEEHRLVPMPMFWQKLYELLPNRRRKATGGIEPPAPLILAAWHSTSDEEKARRLQEHLHWAEVHGELDKIDLFLRGLPEASWCRRGEL